MSEAFEDARSEVESQLKSPVRLSDSLDNIQVDTNGLRLELVSKELNHLAAILHVYARGLIFMK
jgi:hypothetical protein